MKAGVDGAQKSSELAEDVEAIALKNFSEREPRIMLKTIARGVTKYMAFRTARKKQGEVAGLLVNIFNIATEGADTRSWLTLPNSFGVVRMSLPPGRHDLHLSFYNKSNQRIDSVVVRSVEIKEDDFTFLNYRTFK